MSNGTFLGEQLQSYTLSFRNNIHIHTHYHLEITGCHENIWMEST